REPAQEQPARQHRPREARKRPRLSQTLEPVPGYAPRRCDFPRWTLANHPEGRRCPRRCRAFQTRAQSEKVRERCEDAAPRRRALERNAAGGLVRALEYPG